MFVNYFCFLFAPETHIVLFFQKGSSAPSVVHSYGAEAVYVDLPDGEEWNNYRFYFVRDYMASTAVDYDMAAFADVRDVAVQSNPWHHPLAVQAYNEGAIVVSFEAYSCASPEHGREKCIKEPFTYTQPVNGKWVKDCFGESTFKTCFEQSPVSCVGFTLGHYQAMKRYVNLWVDLVASPMHTCSSKYHGADTAFHAYIIHCMTKEESGFSVIKAEAQESVVNTLGTSFPHWYNKFYQIVNRDGDVSPVLHQYDRSANLSSTLFAMYPYSTAGGKFMFGA